MPELYERLLGATWSDLPAAIRLLHGEDPLRARGRMRVVEGRRPLARAVLRLLKKPRAGDSVDVHLDIARRASGETWRRTFDDVRLESWQREAQAGVLEERIGFFVFRFRLTADRHALIYEQVSAAAEIGPLRLRLPARLAPRIEASERPCGSACVQVQVRVTWPPAGLILAYDGEVHIEDHA